jgi:hypothetical protein
MDYVFLNTDKETIGIWFAYITTEQTNNKI